MTTKLLTLIATLIVIFMLIRSCNSWSFTITDKKLLELQPRYQEEAQELINWIRKTYPDYKLVIAEVYRTQKRQDELYKKGRHLTQVKISKHTMKKAMDIYFVNDMRILRVDEAPYTQIGQEWIRRGHIWGGSWVTIKDFGHFEWK